ncbi:hypothetical protein BH24CHL1_BH24CHL1_12280 [soil metagenome]
MAVNDPILLEDIGERIMPLHDPDSLAVTLVQAAR